MDLLGLLTGLPIVGGLIATLLALLGSLGIG